jgi:hypothetical protein
VFRVKEAIKDTLMRRVDHITADKLGESNGASFKAREVLEGELMQEIDKCVRLLSWRLLLLRMC